MAVYSIDTSILIHGWVRAYPITVPMFVPVWDQLDRLIGEGVVRASEEVLSDLQKREGDSLTAWCEERKELFVPVDDPIQETVGLLMGKYPRLVDTVKGKSESDPWVISLAMQHNPRMTIVTEEKGGSADRPSMPYVCEQEGIRHINLLDLIKETTR